MRHFLASEVEEVSAHHQWTSTFSKASAEMSTEQAQPGNAGVEKKDNALRKEEKRKRREESKKRKREVENGGDDAQIPHEQSKKKHKKDKKTKHDDAPKEQKAEPESSDDDVALRSAMPTKASPAVVGNVQSLMMRNEKDEVDSDDDTPLQREKLVTVATEQPSTAQDGESAKPSKREKKREKKRKDKDEQPETSTMDLTTIPQVDLRSPEVQHDEAHKLKNEQEIDRAERKRRKKLKKSHGEASSSTTTTHAQFTSQDSSFPSSADAENRSPFTQLTTSLYLPLSPCAYNSPLAGVCAEHISPHLLTYFPPLRGVLFSYANARLSEHPNIQKSNTEHTEPYQPPVLASNKDAYGVSFLWLTADFTIFRPVKGTVLEGVVSTQTPGMVGLICYNYFNAVIMAESMPEGWRWVSQDEGGLGCWVDGQGDGLEGRVRFWVDDFEVDEGAGTVGIMGSLKRPKKDTRTE